MNTQMMWVWYMCYVVIFHLSMEWYEVGAIIIK